MSRGDGGGNELRLFLGEYVVIIAGEGGGGVGLGEGAVPLVG